LVDEIDAVITHVIRGDDHLTNAFRQTQLYRALDKEPPCFAHIPLIHGPDGAKLSKRHGALSVTEYRELGFLPEAVCNYLMRLGWSHGDAEIISREEAVAWFDLDGVGRAAARLDLAKLLSVNSHWLRQRSDEDLIELIRPWLARDGLVIDEVGEARLRAGMDGLKQRSRTLVELARGAAFYVRQRPLPLDDKAVKALEPPFGPALASLIEPLEALPNWEDEVIEAACRGQADQLGLPFGKLAQALRAALTGGTVSPSLFEIMRILGLQETTARIRDAAGAQRTGLATA
jgi:glutamyl-tRNA synthetase